MMDAKRQSTLVRDAEWLWRATVDESPLAMLVVHSDGTIEFINRAAVRLVGAKEARATLAALTDNSTVCDELLALARSAIAQQRTLGMECSIGGKFMHVVIRPIPGDEPRSLMVMQLAAMIEDASLNGYPLSRSKSGSGMISNLTTRELEVLKLIGHGLSTQQIAERLGRSVKTIEWHRVSLGEKLGVTNRVELARVAILAGVSGLGPLPDASHA